jgi:hypothetical protein
MIIIKYILLWLVLYTLIIPGICIFLGLEKFSWKAIKEFYILIFDGDL